MTIPTFSGSPSNKLDVFSQARLRYTQIIITITLLAEFFSIIIILASATIDLPTKLQRDALIAAFMVVDAFLLYRLRRGEALQLAVLITSVKLSSAVFIAAGLSPYWWLVLIATLTVLTTATLAPRWLYLATNAVVLGQVIYSILNHNFQRDLIATDETPGLILLFTLVALSVTTRFFTNTSQQAAEAAGNSARLLRAAAATGQDLSKMLNINEILPRAVEFIRERFGFYHVQVFLIDDDGLNARLAASTGAVGQKLFERQHSLPVGSKSVIGTVAATGKMVVARDTDAFYFRNELLPNTRSELALPIFDGDKIIGALDVQSRRYDVFEDEIVQALQALANQLGTSIRNARLFESQEKNTRETKRLFLDAETNLREIQRLNQQLTRQGWQNFLNNNQSSSGITVDNEHVTNEGGWSDALIKATKIRQPVRENRDGQPVIAVPVMLGNEVIGAIEVESNERRADAETVEMVQAVAQRLAISLDKARLFEESQAATAREQRINEIVGRYQTVTNVDELLRITLSELSQTLGAKHSAIRLGSVVNANGNGENHV
jgi:GAF domain-containing protein